MKRLLAVSLVLTACGAGGSLRSMVMRPSPTFELPAHE